MPLVVLITGCSTGLGRALAEELAARKDERSGEPRYRVFATARKLQSLEGLPPQVETVALDVTDDKSVTAAVKSVLDKAGRVDILINNAGLGRAGPLLEQDLSQVHEVINTNCYGVLRMVQAVVPGMVERRSGLVVNVGSGVSWMTLPFSGAYSASKAALFSLSHALRLELFPFNVQVTHVTAGSIRSSFNDNNSKDVNIPPTSPYAGIADIIRDGPPQDPKSVPPPEKVARQIIAVIERSTGPKRGLLRRRPSRAPAWFLAGGSATMVFILGLMQKIWGSPTDGVLEKMFGIKKLAAMVDK